MIEGIASRTARDQAIGRAMESIVPKENRVCYDPLAVEFLDDKFRRRYELTRNSKFSTKMLLWSLLYRDPSGSRAEAAGRTRYIDDYLQTCLRTGCQQVCILGAGYDSRAYRFKAAEGTHVFEIDHPDTQRPKMASIKRVLGDLPRWVSYVPVDFEKEKMEERLLTSGYCRDSRTVFIWEGVTMYLTAEAVDKTLSFVLANSGSGSSIIFNYWYKSAVDGESKWRWAKALKRRCKQLGEPITFGIEGEHIEDFLAAKGFLEVKRVTPALLNGFYFQGPNARRKVCPFIEIVHATVGPSA